MNRSAIELYDGSGYFGQMSAYHHLHCLVCPLVFRPSTQRKLIERKKFLRQVLHSDYYDVDTPDKDTHVGTPLVRLWRLARVRTVTDGKQDHCVDDIRQALMCHADTSIVTFDWKPQYRRPWPNFSIDHTCVKWEALDDWASERSFSAFDQKSLVHPELGEMPSPFQSFLQSKQADGGIVRQVSHSL